MKHGMRVVIAWSVAILLAVVVAAAWAATKGEADQADASKRLQEQNRTAYEMSAAFSRAAAFVMPAVVNISVEKKVETPAGPFRFPPELRDWPMPSPDDRRWRRWPMPEPEERDFKMPGVGAGFVIAAEGYVLTNAHVVEGVEKGDIRILFSNGKEFTPTGVLRDKRSDIALLKIDGGPFQALELANSDEVQPGQWVLAVGSPSGFGYSVSAGVVSARSTQNRFMAGKRMRNFSAMHDDPYAQEDYIQTDTTINPGNSGGPLIDLYGRVVGVNTLIISGTRQYSGLSFAIPANKVRTIKEQLLKQGKVVRGHLGVRIADPADLADAEVQDQLRQQGLNVRALKSLDLKAEDKGAVVLEVIDDTPADKADLQFGDLIVEFGGKPVRDVNELRKFVADTAPGTKVKLVVQRNRKRETLEVTLGEQPSAEEAVARGESLKLSELGVDVQEVSPDLAKRLGIQPGKGLVITNVRKGSPADKAKLEPGSVIVDVWVGGKPIPVRTVKDLQEALARSGKGGVTLRISREDATQLVEVKP